MDPARSRDTPIDAEKGFNRGGWHTSGHTTKAVGGGESALRGIQAIIRGEREERAGIKMRGACRGVGADTFPCLL